MFELNSLQLFSSYYLMIDAPNCMPSALKQTAKSLMVGRKNNQKQKQLRRLFKNINVIYRQKITQLKPLLNPSSVNT